MLLCFYAHLVRSGMVCEGLSEKGDRQVWNGEVSAREVESGAEAG
jgi:hypothetical protein